MGHDKKNVSGKVRLTLLSQIGKGVYDISCDESLLRESLKYLIALNND
jgi:3-dehydroquinate synthetase